ncbi:DUF3102 domain-containing protein [Alicyclobacillus sp. SO9]|uniref:DUF3102 domain-containing protein n=1 Tax=Alicyclobacillus sp. SO9 TaxID=2665646 RepID=UPI0018E8FAD1|nr:DUF3102 domain-containing protein [Alicyclobacillus sp. SO9]QQE81572.1 DUF3102 domain-containing protein [Alicyclobacillus sp. SO9]
MEQLASSDLQQIADEIQFLKAQTAFSMIEIGKRLIRVKESLEHGQWIEWLDNQARMNVRSAQRFMKGAQLATQIRNTTALSHLSQTQVLSVLDLGPSSADEFLQTPHSFSSGETKTVEQMTTRETQEAVRKWKAAEQRAKEMEEQNVSLIERSRTIREENEELKRQKNPEPKVVEVAPPDYQDVLQENQEMNTRIAQLTGEMDSIRADYQHKLQDVRDGDRKAQMRELKRLLQEQLKAVGWNHSAALFLYQQLDGNKEASQYLHDFLNDYEQVVRQQITDWHNAMTLNTEEEITACKTV